MIFNTIGQILLKVVFDIKMGSYQNRNSHYKDKMVIRPSYLCKRNSYIWIYGLYTDTGPSSSSWHLSCDLCDKTITIPPGQLWLFYRPPISTHWGRLLIETAKHVKNVYDKSITWYYQLYSSNALQECGISIMWDFATSCKMMIGFVLLFMCNLLVLVICW